MIDAANDNTRGLLFGDFFFGLRRAGLPVGMSEWMVLMNALDRGVIEPNLTEFYHISRSLLIKHEARFDLFDEVFAAVFKDGEMPSSLADELMAWLENPKPLPQLSPEQLEAMEALPIDKLRELFEERLKEQKERHDGGNRWIGTGGTSPFGHGGKNPAGVRVGGAGGGRSAVQIASERRFRDYRNDQVLDTRSMAVALKKLKRLSRQEGEPELDVEQSIDETCKNAGDLTLVFEPPKKNQARVLLLMDVGGSMDPHSAQVERLFSAANGLGHWRQFDALCFHNCPYETLWSSMWRGEGRPTADILSDLSPETFLVVVGDASMAPTELTARWGAIDYFHRNETPGVVWLHRLRSRFKRAVWLNPLPPRWWQGYSTVLIQKLFPMYPLTIHGLEDAIDTLIKGNGDTLPELDQAWFDSLHRNMGW